MVDDPRLESSTAGGILITICSSSPMSRAPLQSQKKTSVGSCSCGIPYAWSYVGGCLTVSRTMKTPASPM